MNTEYEMNIENFEYESEPEMNIINFIKVCRFCDNLRKGRSLNAYTRGLEQLKVCMDCRNDICAIKNGMFLSRISRLHRLRKIKQAKQNVVIILHQLQIGIHSGIHQHLLEFVL